MWSGSGPRPLGLGPAAALISFLQLSAAGPERRHPTSWRDLQITGGCEGRPFPRQMDWRDDRPGVGWKWAGCLLPPGKLWEDRERQTDRRTDRQKKQIVISYLA